jgi:hypothetical protein
MKNAPPAPLRGRGIRRRSRTEAAEILVGAGMRAADLQMTLPDAGPRRTIRIRIVDEAGRPAAGALVVETREGPGDYGKLSGHLVADVQGRATAEGY